MNITKNTAIDIALAYREIETAEKILVDISEAQSKREMPDIRDAFGRIQSGLTLGVPSGNSSLKLFDVPWSLCKPIIEGHIANKKTILSALSEKAKFELSNVELPDNGDAA